MSGIVDGRPARGDGVLSVSGASMQSLQTNVEADPSLRGRIDAFDWNDFFTNYWGRRPVLFKNPFAAPLCPPALFFDLLVEQQRRIKAGKPAEVILCNSRHEAIYGGMVSKRLKSPLESLLPTKDDQDMGEYVGRLRGAEGYDRFGICVEAAQRFVPIWRQAAAVLRNVYRHIDLPREPINCDVWIGNYPMTPIGVHKDRLDNLMFMIHGRRRMRLWDDTLWRQLVVVEDEYEPFREYEKFVQYATTFDLEAGDLLYWPASFWHVGEGEEDYSISINLDFIHPAPCDSLHPLARRAVSSLMERAAETIGSDPHESRPASNARQKRLEGDQDGQELPAEAERSARAIEELFLGRVEFESELRKQWMNRRSALGFNTGPPPLKRRAASAADYVRTDPDFPILWQRVGERLFVSCSGQTMTVPYSDALVGLLNRLRDESLIEICGLFDEAGLGRNDSPGAHPTSLRDAAENVIEFLCSRRALIPMVRS